MPFTKKVTRYTSDGKVIELRSRQYSEVWIDIVDSGICQPFELLVIILILAIMKSYIKDIWFDK